MKFKKKYLAIFCACSFLLISEEVIAATNGYGETTASPSDTGSNGYEPNLTNPYIDFSNSYNGTIILPMLSNLVGTNFSTDRESFNTISDFTYDNNTLNSYDPDMYEIYFLDRNNVGGGNINLRNLGEKAISILYKNYAKDIHLANYDGSSSWVEANDVAGANIINSDSTAYFYNNSADNAVINNIGKTALMVFNGNGAHGVSVTNQGIISAAHNILTEGIIQNTSGATISLYGNDFSGALLHKPSMEGLFSNIISK